ncbi:hypothetical protein EJ110_NYTH28577 [Nymphaea thermarum]|nr:hypothetical protein EJ110_NYTH28577 [Nymphaea thermarum]
MKPLAMFTGLGAPMKESHVGIIPCYATDDSKMKWIKASGYNLEHSVNAWDEKGGEEEVLVAANIMSVKHLLEMRTSRCTVLLRGDGADQCQGREGGGEEALSTRNLEFGLINPKFVGMKNRYTFMAKGEVNGKFSGIVKLDFDLVSGNDCVVDLVSRADNFPPVRHGKNLIVVSLQTTERVAKVVLKNKCIKNAL